MKDPRYANRGMGFEQFIRYANSRYEHEGLAVIAKIPTEFIPLRDRSGSIYSAKVEHKSEVDFIGRYKQYPIAIEAKETSTDSIRFDRVEPHQAEFMNKFNSQEGTIGIVLLSFGLNKFYAVPWAFWSMAQKLRNEQNDRNTSILIAAFNQEWEIPKKKSVRADELLPEWEVPGNDLKYALHYLVKADQYVTGKHWTGAYELMP